MKRLCKENKITVKNSKKENSKWINVGVVDKDTPREEVTNLIREAVIKARELVNKEGE